MDSDPNVPPQNQSTPISPRNASIIWMVLGLVILLVFLIIIANPTNPAPVRDIDLGQLAEDIQAGEVDSITVRGGTDVMIRLDNGDTYAYTKEREVDILQQLQAAGITSEQLSAVEYQETQRESSSEILFQLIIALIPTLIFIALLWFMLYRYKLPAKREQLPPQ